MDYNSIIEKFVKTFIQKPKRERSILDLKNSDRRSKFTIKLNHQWDSVLDMRFVKRIPSGVNDYEFARKNLKIHEGELCYLISDHEDLDGAADTFGSAFNKVYGRGFGSLVIAATADKFYLETEIVQGKQNRFIGILTKEG